MNLRNEEKPERILKVEKAVKDEFMGNVSEDEGNSDDLFGEARLGEGIGEVEDFDEAPEEDAEPKEILPDPGQPTQADIDEHNVDHYPFRSWCEACIKGRGTGEAHKSGGESTIPVIAFDHLFITKEQVWRREELDEEEEAKVIFKV